ncbi:hypothetical protein DCS_05530 [Drechmeria coniospora]|uniref:Uncharacterized protein n=1 Tax=Drechmeria coniospora TaxID=98403 RepID=A0A151GN14_DRECN|nr:hypothetical protein DCS_05530 [Drechmeria coniospora]KYK58514.1 hypothetical protein DCS_05530 [Drechmeria coniospora]
MDVHYIRFQGEDGREISCLLGENKAANLHHLVRITPSNSRMVKHLDESQRAMLANMPGFQTEKVGCVMADGYEAVQLSLIVATFLLGQPNSEMAREQWKHELGYA